MSVQTTLVAERTTRTAGAVEEMSEALSECADAAEDLEMECHETRRGFRGIERERPRERGGHGGSTTRVGRNGHETWNPCGARRGVPLGRGGIRRESAPASAAPPAHRGGDAGPQRAFEVVEKLLRGERIGELGLKNLDDAIVRIEPAGGGGDLGSA